MVEANEIYNEGSKTWSAAPAPYDTVHDFLLKFFDPTDNTMIKTKDGKVEVLKEMVWLSHFRAFDNAHVNGTFFVVDRKTFCAIPDAP